MEDSEINVVLSEEKAKGLCQMQNGASGERRGEGGEVGPQLWLLRQYPLIFNGICYLKWEEGFGKGRSFWLYLQDGGENVWLAEVWARIVLEFAARAQFGRLPVEQ